MHRADIATGRASSRNARRRRPVAARDCPTGCRVPRPPRPARRNPRRQRHGRGARPTAHGRGQRAHRTGRARVLRCVRQLPARADRPDAGAHRQAVAQDVRAVHAADARPDRPAAPDCVRLADPARRRCDCPVDEAGPQATRDPPRHRPRSARDQCPAAAPARSRRELAGLRPSSPDRLGQRLAELLPHGRLVEVEDSYTLIALDQPAKFARIIGEFSPVPGRT